MIKELILSAALMSSYQAVSQKSQEYLLNSSVTVGCYNANPLADMSKKIEVTVDGDKAKFSIASISCKKEFNGAIKVDFGSGANGYFDKKEKRGIIVDGAVVSLFKEEGGKYQIDVAGHEDKKEAKVLSTEEQQAKHKAVFDNFDATLEKAQKEADHAAKMAKVLPIPTGDYSDKYGMGGLYYFSELQPISSHTKEIDGKYAQAVLLHFDESDNFVLKAYITNTVYDKYYFDGSKMFKAFKEGKITTVLFHANDNMNSAGRNNLTRLEDGLYLIGGFLCSEAEKGELKTHTKSIYPLLGKDKSRVEYLKNHPEEVERLALLSTYNQCKLNDALTAAEKPMPAASAMNTGKLKIEATELTKAFAKGRWSQEVIYSYIMGKEWFTLRNQLTGVITGRVISAIAIMKTEDGACKWEEISIRQNYDGANYGASYFGGESTVIIPVDCTTAMKYK